MSLSIFQFTTNLLPVIGILSTLLSESKCSAATIDGRLLRQEAVRGRGEILPIPKSLKGAVAYISGDLLNGPEPAEPPAPLKIDFAGRREPRFAIVRPLQRMIFNNNGKDDEYGIFLNRKEWLCGGAKFRLQPGEVHDVYFDRPIRGKVFVVDANMEREFVVFCVPAGCAAVTDESGKFELRGVPEGKYELGLWFPEYRKYRLQGNDGNIKVNLKGDEILHLGELVSEPR